MREIIDGADWMRGMERRLREESRRPTIRNAADLLGIGFGPTATRLMDWNDDAAALNGMFYSDAGAINGPDGGVGWIGTTLGTADGAGVQQVRTFDSSPVVMTRTFSPTAGTRSYTPWQPERWSEQAEQATNLTVTPGEASVLDLAVTAAVPTGLAVFACTASLDWRRVSNDTPMPIVEARLKVNGANQGTALRWSSNTVDAEITVSKTWRVTGLPVGTATFGISAGTTSTGNYLLRLGSTLLVSRLA